MNDNEYKITNWCIRHGHTYRGWNCADCLRQGAIICEVVSSWPARKEKLAAD